MLNLDTHIVIHALMGGLRASERAMLSRRSWSISAIVIWEIAMLSERQRIVIDIDSPEFSLFLASVHVWPIDLAVCRAIRRLDYRSDPADNIIGATSLVQSVPLVTRDAVLRRSKVVPLAHSGQEL